MTQEINGNESAQNPDRAPRLAVERQLIEVTLQYAAIRAGGPPETIAGYLRDRSKVITGEDGKPTVMVSGPDGVTISPRQAVAAVQGEMPYLWVGAQSPESADTETDLTSLDSDKYRGIRATNPELIFGKSRRGPR